MESNTTTNEFLHVDHLSYSYHTLAGETTALKDVSFHVSEGQFLAIVGPSGCGKSTLLSLIAGLIKPDAGSIYIKGKDTKSSGLNIGYMLQKDHLLDWRSTLRNVALGLEVQHKYSDQSMVIINHLLETYGLISFIDSKPTELSGGMRQRAALIRTLLLQPDILLLDEPFSALDYQTRLEVSDDICKIIRKENKTAVLITHDIAEAISTADRVIVLSNRPASIKKEFEINLTSKDESPLQKRLAPEFSTYFNLIWKELTSQ
ncbi:ABC transporter ATP-binding protein [Lachnoclostridium phytofermentans]|uniref:ABC transporter related n=1 Tax=Lachnoclostridium phytofermentans (strain ATCC 700394 / DSM 18823 / ISDg) TaxID=357809 RepID=A9KKL9_LACP7|nr:ABC transporter ATP-binding protein [Lachnoclostridium phytofermentans]ABX41190.1 ABC transporter related [Lachnoclostridium phytofermentans ISDg]